MLARQKQGQEVEEEQAVCCYSRLDTLYLHCYTSHKYLHWQLALGAGVGGVLLCLMAAKTITS